MYKEGLNMKKTYMNICTGEVAPRDGWIYTDEGGKTADLDKVRQKPIISPTIPSPYTDISWVDDNDGCGPRKLQNSIRCFQPIIAAHP
jgi:hypothetical protein